MPTYTKRSRGSAPCWMGARVNRSGGFLMSVHRSYMPTSFKNPGATRRNSTPSASAKVGSGGCVVSATPSETRGSRWIQSASAQLGLETRHFLTMRLGGYITGAWRTITRTPRSQPLPSPSGCELVKLQASDPTTSIPAAALSSCARARPMPPSESSGCLRGWWEGSMPSQPLTSIGLLSIAPSGERPGMPGSRLSGLTLYGQRAPAWQRAQGLRGSRSGQLWGTPGQRLPMGTILGQERPRAHGPNSSRKGWGHVHGNVPPMPPTATEKISDFSLGQWRNGRRTRLKSPYSLINPAICQHVYPQCLGRCALSLDADWGLSDG